MMAAGGSTITPPVGRSGPGRYFNSVRLLAFGVSIRWSAASQSSAALWGGIAVAIAEVPLSVDQRIALGKILGEAHERVVHRLVAVRMEFADDVADHPRAFLEPRTGLETQLLHRVQEPPVNGLEPVARIRQRAPGDGGERVLEIALLQRLPQRNLLDLAVARGNQVLSHAQELMPGQAMNKR